MTSARDNVSHLFDTRAISTSGLRGRKRKVCCHSSAGSTSSHATCMAKLLSANFINLMDKQDTQGTGCRMQDGWELVLPPELWQHAFLFLPLKALVELALVSKRW